MDAATAQPMIDEVDDAIKQAESLAASTSDPTLQGQQENATAMLRKSWSDWSTRQLQQTESNPPTRTDENWTEYGGTTDESDANSGSLLAQAKRFIRDNGSIYAQWSAAINTAGNAAQAVESYVQSNIKAWRTALEGYKASLAAFQAKEQSAQGLEAALKPVADQLSPEAHELLYGQSAQDAVNKLALLPTLISKAEAVISALESGEAAIFSGGDVQLATDAGAAPQTVEQQLQTPTDFSMMTAAGVDQDETGAQGIVSLGNPWAVAGLVVAGLIALLAIIGTIVAWLEGYYQHLGQVSQSDEINKLLAVANNPNSTPEAREAAKKAIEELAKHPPPDPLKPLAALGQELEELLKTGAYIAGGVALVLGGRWVWDNFGDEIKAWLKKTFGRKTNPRRRRARNGKRRTHRRRNYA